VNDGKRSAREEKDELAARDNEGGVTAKRAPEVEERRKGKRGRGASSISLLILNKEGGGRGLMRPVFRGGK